MSMLHTVIRPGRLRIVVGLAALLIGAPASAQTALKFTLNSAFEGPTAPVLAALDRGYFKREKIEVAIAPAKDSREAIARIASGAHDMGVADINTLIRLRDQTPEAPIKAVFMLYNNPAFAIVGRKSRGIHAPKDLEGKKLGAPAADEAAAQWKIFAQANGIDVAKVKVENIGMPLREPMLQNGQVDAVTGFSFSLLPNLKFMGVPADDIVVLLMADFEVALYGDAIVVNAKFAADKPEAVRAFLRAFVRSLREVSRDPARAIDSVLKRNDEARRDVELERLRMAVRDHILTAEVRAEGFGGVNFARFDKAIEQLALAHAFKVKPKASDIFDPAFLPPLAERKVN